jgi:taurine dioxygenase
VLGVDGRRVRRALEARLQTFLTNLTATHNISKSFPAERWGVGADEAKYREVLAKNPPVVHPVIRVHPVTQRLGLFVNSGFTTHINELSRPESDALLQLLFAHVSRPEFTVRWRWTSVTSPSGTIVSRSTTRWPTTCRIVAPCIARQFSAIVPRGKDK